MVQKLFLVGVIVVSVIFAYLIWFSAGLNFHQEAAQIAINGSPYSSNMTGLVEFVGASPWLLSFLPAGVAVVAVIMVLRGPEIVERVKNWKR